MIEVEKKAHIDAFSFSFGDLEVVKQTDFDKQDTYFLKKGEIPQFPTLSNLLRLRVNQGEMYLTCKQRSFVESSEVNQELEVFCQALEGSEIDTMLGQNISFSEKQRLQQFSSLQWEDFLASLGYRTFLKKRKVGESFRREIQGFQVLLERHQIFSSYPKSFLLGSFIEAEILVDSSSKIPLALKELEDIFEHLRLANASKTFLVEPRGYIEMLL